MEKRLQKIISEMGLASRRKAEDMIREGRLTVNGKVAVLGVKADPDRDHIKLDGKLISGRADPKVYLAFNKPRHVVSTLSEAEDRTTIKDFLGKVKYRVYPVGRLDFDSEGLILITNDGEFANMVMHPRHKLPKVYEVKVDGVLEDNDIEKLIKGVFLDDGMARAARVKKLKKLKANSWVEITLTEGRKRQIRRMLQRVGHPVITLKRTRIGSLALGMLKPGELRYLSNDEIEKLKHKAMK